MAKLKSKTAYIFISGGVLSGLGKGVTAAALGSLLKLYDLNVGSIKCENYLNIDSGTINPIEHGDPFLCADGLEADMDLGTYERFLEVEMGRLNFTTMGQIYQSVINRERNMGYGGEDVEAVPHVVEEILTRIKAAGKGHDICLVELGGTAGEYQNVLYYEACRVMKREFPGQVINVHVSYLPVPKHLGEPKTKPTQMSVKALMAMGIQPEFLVLRGEVDLDERRRYLLGMSTNVDGDKVMMARDLDTVYELPLKFAEQEFDKRVLETLGIKGRKRKPLTIWKNLVAHIKEPRKSNVTIGIVGKYFNKNKGDHVVLDTYHALIESLKHASWKLDYNLNLEFISAEDVEEMSTAEMKKSMSKLDGVIVPIGWGSRGVEGKIKTIKYARENKLAYLGLCYGMQLAAVEFARNVLGMKDAHSTEVLPETTHPIIHDIPVTTKYQTIKGDGVSMRLGSYDCILKTDSLAEKIYMKHKSGQKLTAEERKKIKATGGYMISERHRHRFEFNNEYREQIEAAGLIISGTSPDDFFVEMVEIDQKDHPFFIATQAHPEYKSTPHHPHPMFVEYLDAAFKNKK